MDGFAAYRRVKLPEAISKRMLLITPLAGFNGVNKMGTPNHDTKTMVGIQQAYRDPGRHIAPFMIVRAIERTQKNNGNSN